MRATDLMIGDWVKCGRRYMKVTQLAEDMDCDDIDPIIITPEILEKNFESESNIFGLQTYKLNENFNLENRGERFCLVRKCRAYYTSTFWICDLVHLHQLQHALKLCGIEKEIKLED
jgi:hypothetical protein